MRPLPVKLLRSPNSKTDKSQNSRLSLNIFYFVTGDYQKDNGMETEFMLDRGVSCSITNYRKFWEICQLKHPITWQKRSKVTKTYSRQTVPMIGYATITFCWDPYGQFILLLTVWISEMRTQNLPSKVFCPKQVPGIQINLNYQGLRTLQSRSSTATFTKTNPILIYHKFWLLGPLIRCILALKVPVVGSSCSQTLIHTFHQAQFFNRKETLWLPFCPL